MQERVDHYADAIRHASASGSGVRVRGSGSKDFYGQALRGEPLDVRDYAGIIDYEPTELVVTARAGTPLAELERVLADHGQMLACELPHFGPGATLGGCVAAGLSGPARAYRGAVRDYVLGVRLLDGEGQDLRFGGQVMKNVAGYDVSRLMTGSLGTLALLLEISLKVLPRPAAELTRRLALPEARAIEAVNQWAGASLPLSATYYCQGELNVRLSGATSAVQAAATRIGGESVVDAEAFWMSVREQTLAFFRARPLWRLSVPATAPPLALPGEQAIEWGGALRWLRSDERADVIRAQVARAGGYATLFRADDKRVPAFQPLAPGLAALHKRVKRAFDPHGVFGPHRLYDAL